MQRFINDADLVVEDMLAGFADAHNDLVVISPENNRVITVKDKVVGKVGLVSGGGSGHEPAFLGYVGHNFLDAVAVGEVFSSPTAQTFYDAFKAAETGAGVLCLFGNYAGDTMNVNLAIEMAEDDGFKVQTVIAKDDIASAPYENRHKRHGIAGGSFIWKVAGASAAEGANIDQVIKVAQKTADRTRSLCVGLSGCTIPAVGHPNFQVEKGKMEFGIGHHGEAGIRVTELPSANIVAKELVATLLADFALQGNERDMAVMLSGLGSTPLMELYILWGAISQELAKNNISIINQFIGNYVTSLDMNGVCLTLLHLDDEIAPLLAKPAHCPAMKF